MSPPTASSIRMYFKCDLKPNRLLFIQKPAACEHWIRKFGPPTPDLSSISAYGDRILYKVAWCSSPADTISAPQVLHQISTAKGSFLPRLTISRIYLISLKTFLFADTGGISRIFITNAICVFSKFRNIKLIILPTTAQICTHLRILIVQHTARHENVPNLYASTIYKRTTNHTWFKKVGYQHSSYCIEYSRRYAKEVFQNELLNSGG